MCSRKITGIKCLTYRKQQNMCPLPQPVCGSGRINTTALPWTAEILQEELTKCWNLIFTDFGATDFGY